MTLLVDEFKNMPESIINILLSYVVALVVHEMGHLLAARLCNVTVTEAGLGWGPKLFNFRLRGIDYHLRLLPFGAYVRMDMAELQRCTLVQQLFVLLAGIAVNLLFGVVAWGTFFGTLNLTLAIGNLFPLYQQDGWKSGMVIFRRLFRGPSPIVEWSFTISAGLVGLGLLARAVFTC